MRILPAVVCVAVGVAAGGWASEDRRPTEYEVKAAFVYHFAQLVEWPPGRDADGAVTIAVVRHPDFARALEKVVEGRRLRDRPVRVRHYRSIHHVRGRPEIVVTSARTPAEVRQTVAAFATDPVLTVGDGERFAERGGMIGFRVTPEGRVAFDINVEHAQKAGLRISSQLLKLARIVRSG